MENESNSYSDNIPLRQHQSKASSDMVMQDHLPDDPAIIDRPPQSANRRRRKQGFFGREIPWVVYTLTLIQIVVFIAELGRNGEYLQNCHWCFSLTCVRRSHQNPH